MEPMKENYEIMLPELRFMHVKIVDGKAIITFSNHCMTDGHYNLEVHDGGEWVLPTENETKGD
jgi:hypothetical protein